MSISNILVPAARIRRLEARSGGAGIEDGVIGIARPGSAKATTHEKTLGRFVLGEGVI